MHRVVISTQRHDDDDDDVATCSGQIRQTFGSPDNTNTDAHTKYTTQNDVVVSTWTTTTTTPSLFGVCVCVSVYFKILYMCPRKKCDSIAFSMSLHIIVVGFSRRCRRVDVQFYGSRCVSLSHNLVGLIYAARAEWRIWLAFMDKSPFAENGRE